MSIRIITICIYIHDHACICFLLYTIFPRYHLRAQLQKHQNDFTVTFAIQRSKAVVKRVCTLFELQHSLKLSRLACPPNGVKWVMIHDLCGGLGFMKRRTVPHCPTLAKGQTQRQERGQTARLAQAEVPRDYQIINTILRPSRPLCGPSLPPSSPSFHLSGLEVSIKSVAVDTSPYRVQPPEGQRATVQPLAVVPAKGDLTSLTPLYLEWYVGETSKSPSSMAEPFNTF